MGENELLKAISDMIDSKLQPLSDAIGTVDKRLGKIETRLDKVEARLDNLEVRLDKVETRLDNLEARLDKVEANMVTKDDLRRSENMILNELDRVQEKANQKFNNLRFEVV